MIGKLLDAAGMFWQACNSQERLLALWLGLYVVLLVLSGLFRGRRQEQEARIVLVPAGVSLPPVA